MFLLMPIIGRRTVIKKLTLDYFGRQESQRWYYAGPIGVGLHFASNAVNTAIIKGVAGFEQTSIKNFTFFWCTRPRLSLLIVALIQYEAHKSMYLSATASILFCEAILQIFAGYYMGVGANYARRQEFFSHSHLVGSWYAKQAMIMYVGSILWLVAVPFAITACLWTALGVNERIGRLGEYWTETRKVVKKHGGIASTEAGKLRTLKSRISPAGQGPWQQQLQTLQNRLSTEIDAAVVEWDDLKATWDRMHDELRKEQNETRKVKREVQKARYRLENTREGTPKWQERWQRAHTAEQDELTNNDKWLPTPETRQSEARMHQSDIDHQIAADLAQKTDVEVILAVSERNMLPFEHAIAEAETRIAADDAEMERIKSMQKGYISSRHRKRLHDLRDQYENIAQQRMKRLKQLKTAENNPQLGLERNRAETLRNLIDSWDVLLKRKRNLRRNWVTNEDQWKEVARKRSEERVTKPKVGHFPIVVVVGMMLCWIAQWLWWAGYVGVAGDGYCPPKLPALASIWIVFSSMGKSHGPHGNQFANIYQELFVERVSEFLIRFSS
jgi:hypothetical protein